MLSAQLLISLAGPVSEQPATNRVSQDVVRSARLRASSLQDSTFHAVSTSPRAHLRTCICRPDRNLGALKKKEKNYRLEIKTSRESSYACHIAAFPVVCLSHARARWWASKTARQQDSTRCHVGPRYPVYSEFENPSPQSLGSTNKAETRAPRLLGTCHSDLPSFS